MTNTADLPNDTDVSGLVIGVTGAARGLGRAFAIDLAARGAHTVLMDVDDDGCRTAADEISRQPGTSPPLVLKTDVADERSVQTSMAAISARFDHLDVIISNAAFMPPRTAILDTDVAVLEQTLKVNIVGSFLVTKHAVPLMTGPDGGRVIYLSSALGAKSNPGLAPYGATKAAVDIINNVAHQELAERNIRTVAVAPGITDTPGMRNTVGTEYARHVSSRYPGGRLGQPEDILPLIAFLCSPSSRHLSGTVIYVRPSVN